MLRRKNENRPVTQTNAQFYRRTLEPAAILEEPSQQRYGNLIVGPPKCRHDQCCELNPFVALRVEIAFLISKIIQLEILRDQPITTTAVII